MKNDYELNLKNVINIFIVKIKLILSFTIFVTLIAIIFFLFSKPEEQKYIAQASFIGPTENSVLNLNESELITISRNDLYSSFLEKVLSKTLQERVLIEGDFPSINNDNQAIIDFISSVSLGVDPNDSKSTHFDNNNNIKQFVTYEMPYIISITGNNPKVLTDFLSNLIKTANNDITFAFQKLFETKKKSLLDEIVGELELEIFKVKGDIERAEYQYSQKLLNDIQVLRDDVVLATTLGIRENNITKINSSLSPTVVEDFYLYGEQALLVKIEILERKLKNPLSNPIILTLKDKLRKNMQRLDYENLRVNSIKMNLEGFSAYQSYEAPNSAAIIIKSYELLFILIIFFGSFFLSLLIALIHNTLKQDD